MNISLQQVTHFLSSLVKPRDSIAIDIGSFSIKIAQIRRASGKFTLIQHAVIPLGDLPQEMAPVERKNITISRLSEFLAKERISLKNVVTSISGNQVIVRYVKFPKLSREELTKTIRFEAEPYIPFDIDDVDLSFHVLGDIVEENQKKLEAILVAAKKEFTRARLEILDETGLRTVIIDIDAFAVANAYEANIDPLLQETVALINIGASVTNIAIVENGIPKVVRDILIAGNAFSRSIQRNLNCDFYSAEKLKYKAVLLPPQEDTSAEKQKESQQLSNAVLPIAKDLLGEIRKSVDFYISQNPDKMITRILMSGGGSQIINLDKYISQELKLPLEIFNPLKSIGDSEAVPAETAILFSVAAGLGLRKEHDMGRN